METHEKRDAVKVKFHLPGLRYNYPLNMMLLSLQKTFPHYFREGVEIVSFFGEFPTALWSGGRYCSGDQCDGKFVQEVVKSINQQGVAVRYTFTNPNIKPEDLKDGYCNFCMKAADTGMNEVLVVSPVLEEYIRKNYPRFKINSSTCKEIKDMQVLEDELAKDYHLVVLDYNLNNQFEHLEQITRKDKCEILVNSCCVPNCPRRGAHYQHIGLQQQLTLQNRALPKEKQTPVPDWYCEYGENNSVFSIQKYSTFISPEAIWEKYVPMGFTNFKLEGRTANFYSVLETYVYYLVKPEFQGDARILLLTNLEKCGVIKRNLPRRGNWP